jgi:hypothetical protein
MGSGWRPVLAKRRAALRNGFSRWVVKVPAGAPLYNRDMMFRRQETKSRNIFCREELSLRARCADTFAVTYQIYWRIKAFVKSSTCFWRGEELSRPPSQTRSRWAAPRRLRTPSSYITEQRNITSFSWAS